MEIDMVVEMGVNGRSDASVYIAFRCALLLFVGVYVAIEQPIGLLLRNHSYGCGESSA